MVAVDYHHPILGFPFSWPSWPWTNCTSCPGSSSRPRWSSASIPAVASVGVDDYGAPSVALVLSPLDAFTAMRALFCFVVTHPAHN